MSDWGWICIGLGAFFFLAFFYKGLVARHRAKHPVKLTGDQTVETDPGVISLADPYNNRPLTAPSVPAAPVPPAPAAPAVAPATAKPDISTSFSAFHRAFYNPDRKNKDDDSSTPENPYQWA